MTNKGEIYVCEVCGNKVQVLEEVEEHLSVVDKTSP